MIRPCPITPNSCPGEDSPITNLSSEQPDPLLFAGHGWDPYNPYRPPPLGDGPVVPTDCQDITWSSVSQELADLLAQLNAANCRPPNPGGPPGNWPTPPTWDPPPFPDFTFTPPTGDPQSPFTPPQQNYQQFTNESQSATASCPNGAVFTFTIAAGTLVSGLVPTQLGPVMIQLLNAQALAFALQQVWGLRVCIDVPGMVQRRPPTVPPTPIPPPGPGTIGNGPTLAANPGWCCLGATLVPELNTYTVGAGSAEFSFTLGGNVPPGTSLVATGPRSAVLIGTPLAPGEYIYTITAFQTNGPGVAVNITDTLKVFGITNPGLPDGEVGTAYSAQLTTAGGTDPVTFAAVGALPDGLALSASGEITGTPTTDGDFSFAVNFTDAEGGTCQATLPITIDPFVPVNPCVDFGTVAWQAPIFHADSSGSMVPSGTSVAVTYNRGTIPGDAGITGFVVQAAATCIANTHVQITQVGPTQTIDVFYIDSGFNVIADLQYPGVFGPGVGDYDLPPVILPAPDTYRIQIVVDGQLGDDTQFVVTFSSPP